jgi:hypothetical protein
VERSAPRRGLTIFSLGKYSVDNFGGVLDISERLSGMNEQQVGNCNNDSVPFEVYFFHFCDRCVGDFAGTDFCPLLSLTTVSGLCELAATSGSTSSEITANFGEKINTA